MKIHLFLKSSTFFPAHEIALLPCAAMKLAHPEHWPSLSQR